MVVARRFARVAVVALAVVGLSTFLLPSGPQVGAFRSAADQQEFASAYESALAALPPPTQTLDVPTTYGTVRVYRWTPPGLESGTPVLLVPGRAAPAPMWRDLLPHLLRGRPVIAVDALGDLGRSAQTAPLTTMDDQAKWLGEVIDGIGVDRVHLVGHSFGGATAAAVALRRPELVETLTVLEPIFTLAGPPISLYLWAILLTVPAPESWRDHALRRIGGVDEVDRSDSVTTLIERGAVAYSAHLPTPTVLSDDELTQLTMPVYVGIGGRDSLAGGAEAARRAERLVPEATVRQWASATHSLPFQVAEPLSRELDAFWSDHHG